MSRCAYRRRGLLGNRKLPLPWHSGAVGTVVCTQPLLLVSLLGARALGGGPSPQHIVPPSPSHAPGTPGWGLVTREGAQTLCLELASADGGSVPPSPSTCLTGPTGAHAESRDKGEVRTCAFLSSSVQRLSPVRPVSTTGLRCWERSGRKDDRVCAFVRVRPVCWRAASAPGHGLKVQAWELSLAAAGPLGCPPLGGEVTQVLLCLRSRAHHQRGQPGRLPLCPSRTLCR